MNAVSKSVQTKSKNRLAGAILGFALALGMSTSKAHAQAISLNLMTTNCPAGACLVQSISGNIQITPTTVPLSQRPLFIRANVSPGYIVTFNVDNGAIANSQTAAPYDMCGDTSGKPNACSILTQAGSHSIVVSENDPKTGALVGQWNLVVTVGPMQFAFLEMVGTTLQNIVPNYSPGPNPNYLNLGLPVNSAQFVRVTFTNGVVPNHVTFDLDPGTSIATHHVELYAPYDMCGDLTGCPALGVAGLHELVITAYDSNNKVIEQVTGYFELYSNSSAPIAPIRY